MGGLSRARCRSPNTIIRLKIKNSLKKDFREILSPNMSRRLELGFTICTPSPVCFSDSELKEIHSKIINILWNTFKFFDLYKAEYDGKTKVKESENVLDRWILSLLDNLIVEVSDGLDGYNTVKAGRPIKDFINDFSTWYVRRSRERVKGDDEKDKQSALATMREILNELAKLIAPIMPFMAEAIYKGVGSGEKESVHLEEW